MPTHSYGQYCPIAKACEILEPRWTMLILSEMWSGSTRFNEIRRGVPGISPTLLSKRLKEMEASGLVERLEDRASGTIDYVITEIAMELEPIISSLGEWAHRNIESEVTLRDLDARLLMWNIRRKINVDALPDRRTVIRFNFPDAKKGEETYWLIAKPGMAVDLCMNDPGFDVDLFIEAQLKAMTSFWIGFSTLHAEVTHDRITFHGSPLLIKTIDKWLVRSSFAKAA